MSGEHIDISVLVCTYNRRRQLIEMLDSVSAQVTQSEFTFEIVVVDNNSSDGTQDAVARWTRRSSASIRYFQEFRQGKSFALNKALSVARGAICAIGDDDLLLPEGYLHSVWTVFREHPEVSIVGGKVRPVWEGEPQPWLTPEHWAAIALTWYGEEPFPTGSERPVCLLAAAFRRDHLLATGNYNEAVSVSRGRVGGIEDSEIYQRMYAAGYLGRYEPSLEIFHRVEKSRLSKSYHRRWHFDRGRNFAVLRDAATEGTGRKILGVPAYMYKMALRECAGWVGGMLRGRTAEAFLRETKLCFLAGFWAHRVLKLQP